MSCSDAVGVLDAAGIATLLQEMLEHAPGVPPALLYCIARARGLIEAPPFESPRAFLRAIGRFERGDRRDVVSALAARIARAGRETAADQRRRERRAMPSVVSQLRRELRSIDRRRYEEQQLDLLMDLTPPVTIAHGGAASRQGSGTRAMQLAAAALAAAMVTGVLVVHGQVDAPVPAVRAPLLDIAPAFQEVRPGAERAVPPPYVLTSSIVEWAPRPLPPHAAPRRTSSRAKPADANGKRHSKVGAVLRFEWLRHLFGGSR